MPDYKLTYFDIDGGRAEPIRIAFHAAGIHFEDKRISFAEFGEQRADIRFTAVPVLEMDGAQVTQSNALSRYVGKLAGLYPTDPLQALYCDEVLGAMEDLIHYIVQTFGLEGEALIAARKKLVEGRMTVFLKGMNDLLVRGGGEYFSDNQLTIADLKVFTQTRSLSSGRLDHVPENIVQQIAPALIDHEKRIGADKRVIAYYSGRT